MTAKDWETFVFGWRFKTVPARKIWKVIKEIYEELALSYQFDHLFNDFWSLQVNIKVLFNLESYVIGASLNDVLCIL